MTTPQPRCVIKPPKTDIYSEAPQCVGAWGVTGGRSGLGAVGVSGVGVGGEEGSGAVLVVG